MMQPSTPERRMLRLTVSDAAVLRACYMPFLQHKGLFVPSSQSRTLGEKFFLVLTLKPYNLTVAGLVTVCWITPVHCSDGRDPGFGLHFDASAVELSAAIESVLAAEVTEQTPGQPDAPGHKQASVVQQEVSYTL